MATAASVTVLAAVLVLVAWGRFPDALVGLVAAAIVVLTGLVSLDGVREVLDRLAPTLVFLVAVFVIAEAARAAGLFEAAGGFLAWRAGGSNRRLVVAIALAVVTVTTVLSLDATAVLFTPVVVGLVRARRLEPEPPLLATTQLANAGSGLLPVSNLTNLLVFSATGLTFGGFALRMALPTAAASGVVVAVVCRPQRLRDDDVAATDAAQPVLDPHAWFVVGMLAALVVGFFVASQLDVQPAWVAAGGAAVLAVATVTARRDRPRDVLAAASPWFVVFVAALAIVVQAAVDQGVGSTARELVPTGSGLGALAVIVVVAAVLANAVNNIPATLLLLPVMSVGPPGRLLALLVGVNVGPNLTYTGSLATLLWRRVVRSEGIEPSRVSFFRFAALATPLALALSTLALWLTLRVTG
ncbi:MAG TPA: SLC13 family permease [Acidimicrobiia bacterium]